MYGIYENGKVIGVFSAPLTVRSNQPVFISDSLSLKRARQKRANQRWEISANIRPENQDAHILFSYLIDKGYTSPVDVLMPQNTGSVARRVVGNTPTASGSANGDTIVVTTTSVIPRGTYIKFANHSKIYLTLTDKAQDNTIRIYPNLVQSVVNQTFVWKDDVIMPCYIDLESVVGMSYTDGILMDMGAMTFVEAL